MGIRAVGIITIKKQGMEMLKATASVKRMRTKVKLYQKQARYATAVALTKTAWDVKRAEDKALLKYLDNPTPFTRRAYLVERATRGKLYSKVFMKRIQEKYLKTQVYGGDRQPKGGAIPVPATSTILNQYGNIPRRMSKQLRMDKKAFFSGVPKGRGRGSAGIYRRLGTSRRSGGMKIEQVIAWRSKPIRYNKRLPFHDVARREAHRRFKGHYRREYKKAMATAR